MQRRKLMMVAASAATTLALLVGSAATLAADLSPTDQKALIDKAADATLATLYAKVKGSQELASKASGVLVFPKVFAAGLVVGGEHGQGALRVAGATVDYYKMTAASLGPQVGAESKALILMFMTQDALDKFRNGKGWAAGADASVAWMKMGANGTVEMTGPTAAINGFALTNAGVMAAATITGSKTTRLEF
jgi:lipid-binding SYLF domain-containing protein